MVHPQEDRNNTLHQAREREHADEPDLRAGRPPHPGEIVGRKEPPYQATGLAAISPLLSHVRFPATLGDIRAAIGEAVVPIDKFRTTRVNELLDRVGVSEFPSSRELEIAISRTFHEQGARQTRGGHQKQRDNVDGAPVR